MPLLLSRSRVCAGVEKPTRDDRTVVIRHDCSLTRLIVALGLFVLRCYKGKHRSRESAMGARRYSGLQPFDQGRRSSWRSRLRLSSKSAVRVPLLALLVVFVIYLRFSARSLDKPAVIRAFQPEGLPRPPRRATTRDGKPRTRRLQIIKAGGIPKEGFGSSVTYMRVAGNLAYLLDADYIVSQTAIQFDRYRASDIVNKHSKQLQAGGRVCDIMEVLLDTPSEGPFQQRMERAQHLLDGLYDHGTRICNGHSDGPLLSEYASKELDRCDTLIINDIRPIYGTWTPCNRAWWQDTIDAYAPWPAHGNDVAIHYRWGDMFREVRGHPRWGMDMRKVAPLVDIIRQENPSVVVNVYMEKSEDNESEQRLREILEPLGGEFNIVQSSSDVEELALMSQARYLFINAGTYSTAAAATGHAQVVVHNNGDGPDEFATLQDILDEMRLKSVFNYEVIDLEKFRAAVRP